MEYRLIAFEKELHIGLVLNEVQKNMLLLILGKSKKLLVLWLKSTRINNCQERSTPSFFVKLC